MSRLKSLTSATGTESQSQTETENNRVAHALALLFAFSIPQLDFLLIEFFFFLEFWVLVLHKIRLITDKEPKKVPH